MRYVRLLTTLALLVIAAGCGLLGSPSDEDSSPPAAAGGPERSKITVAILPTMDNVPIQYARMNGYFKQEGLEVDVVTAGSGLDAVTKMVSGDVQIAFSSYSGFFVPQSKRTADIKLVADVTALAPNNAMVVAAPTSPVKKISDLGGRRVAITARNTLSHLLTVSAAKVNGVDINAISWVELPFPQMTPAMTRGDVDAAFLTEPFLAQAQLTAGVTPIHDTSSGPTKELPVGGYGALSTFVTENPNTIKAFQRAMKKATDEAEVDHQKVEPILMELGKVDQQTARMVNWTHFVSSLDPVRIQRAADLLLEFGAIPERLDVSPMIVRPT